MIVKIIGMGVFGCFLHSEFSKSNMVKLVDDISKADYVIFCVPFSSFRELANSDNIKGKHIINVCSVQEETNQICIDSGNMVTGIHPMFGPRSPNEGRVSVVTLQSDGSENVIKLSSEISKVVTDINGIVITGEYHDKIMAKTHKKVVELADAIKDIVDGAKDIPIELMPTSFKRLIMFAEQFMDMPEGTKTSILANKYI